MIQKLAQFTDVDAALIVGGLSVTAQAAALRAGPAIVVATPGRMIDHVRNSQGFGLEDLSVLVLDEADRLLEMGFKEEVSHHLSRNLNPAGFTERQSVCVYERGRERETETDRERQRERGKGGKRKEPCRIWGLLPPARHLEMSR